MWSKSDTLASNFHRQRLLVIYPILKPLFIVNHSTVFSNVIHGYFIHSHEFIVRVFTNLFPFISSHFSVFLQFFFYFLKNLWSLITTLKLLTHVFTVILTWICIIFAVSYYSENFKDCDFPEIIVTQYVIYCTFKINW